MGQTFRLGLKDKLNCLKPFFLWLALNAFFTFFFKIFNSIISYDVNDTSVVTSILKGITLYEPLLILMFTGSASIIIFSSLLKANFNIGVLDNVSCLNIKLIAQLVVLALAFQYSSSFIIYVMNKISGVDITSGYIMAKESLGIGQSYLYIIYAVLLGPIAEELIFRGLTFSKASKVMPYYKANLFQAFLFAFMHFTLAQFLVGFFFGYLQGHLLKKYKSLMVPIIFHIIANLIAEFL